MARHEFTRLSPSGLFPMDPLPISFPAVNPAPARPDAATEELQARVSALYARAQTDGHIFASPLGPFTLRGRSAWLPRFVFFGPHASDDSWRLAFLAGFDHRDLRSTHALLTLIERLADDAEDGHGLNLAFFPLVDAAGLAFHTPDRQLTRQSWSASKLPEIALLEKDARARSYHGFVKVETAPEGDDVLSVRVREPLGFVAASPDIEILSSEDAEPYHVRFEREPTLPGPLPGPLAIADDLAIRPFELVLRIPADWSAAVYADAVSTLLTRFLRRYRAFQAYGGHL